MFLCMHICMYVYMNVHVHEYVIDTEQRHKKASFVNYFMFTD